MMLNTTFSDAYSRPFTPANETNDPHTLNRRRTVIGVGLSLLAHALLLLVTIRHPLQSEGDQHAGVHEPLTIRLTQARPKPQNVEPLSVPDPVPRPVVHRNSVIALHKANTSPVPQTQQTMPDAEPTPTPPMDMTARLNAKREQRRAANPFAGESDDAPASGNDVAIQNIKRSLESGRHGTNGVFQITSKGVRTAQFSFRGWTTDASNSYRQVIDVDAGLMGDVNRAIVRKMIELIRTHYQGDFNWESQRLGRVVVLSARPGDSAGLEAFLMKEFPELNN